jgi:non-ribosomal peptide synthase protein (TIGR01720 family)
MVPAKIVRLDALPLTAHGKVDRRALPAPAKSRARLEEDFQPPRTPVEIILAGIWTDVLGIDRVGVHENFFQVGGDSILGVQIIARANQAGLKLSTKQLFLCPTIAELAGAARIGATMQAEQDEVTGTVPLTPIQRWFFEKDFFDPHHYNQAVMLEAQHDLAPSSLEAVIKQLLIHHDALRLRFVREASGWRQFNAAFDGNVPFSCVDLSTVPETDHRVAIEEVATGLQSSLDLSEGPLLRAALFNLGASRPGRLLIAIHHLAIDGISWRILLEDLQTACEQLSRGQSIELPPKTTSFKCWSEMLAEHALSDELKRELPYWLDDSWSRAIYLPVDYFEGANLVDSSCTVSVSLSLEETRSLLQEVPEVYHTEINDVLLTALVDAFGEWTGERAVLIDLEGHGREDLFEQADISRTVGWFTSLFPVLLELGDEDDPGEALKSVKEQLRKIPNRGIGYGLLRYPGSDTDYDERLRSFPQAQISFNYLGQFDQVLSKSSAFDLASEVSGPARSSRSSRTHVIEINSSIIGRQLHVGWTYSENIHRRSTIEELARNYMESLRSLISHCQSPEAGGYTLSDVSQFGWDQEDLNRIVARISKNS